MNYISRPWLLVSLVISIFLVSSCHPTSSRDPSGPSAIGIVNVTFTNTESDSPLVEHYIEIDAIFSSTGQEELLPIITDNTGSFRGSIAKETETFITGFIFRFELQGNVHIIEVQADLPLKFDQPYPEVTLQIDVDPEDAVNN